MTLNIETDLIPTSNANRPQTPLYPSKITVHNTGNRRPGADARAHARYVKKPTTRVSWHFTVDDARIIKHLPMNEVGWHAGRRGNAASIGIETCMNSDGDQKKTDDRLVSLVAHLVVRLGMKVDEDVVTHFSWTTKKCPELLLPTWKDFLRRVQQAVDALSSGLLEAATGASSFVATAADVDELTAAVIEDIEVDHEVVASAVADWLDDNDG